MTYDDNAAPLALNAYVRQLLKTNLGWERLPNGLFPLVPISQQPELMSSGKPFVIYGWSRHPSDHLYQYVKESVSYTVFAADQDGQAGVDIVRKVVNLLAETFARQDEAADDVNDFLEQEDNDRQIGFSSVKTTVVQSPDAATEEGGHVAGLVMVEVRYVKLGSNIVTKLEYTP
jgi:hypothetical protein